MKNWHLLHTRPGDEKKVADLLTVKDIAVFWLGEPTIVPAEEIEAVRNFLLDYAGIQLEKSPVDKNDKVRIIYGPLVVREGNSFEVRNSPVSIILPSIGFTLIARERKRDTITASVSLRFFRQREKIHKVVN